MGTQLWWFYDVVAVAIVIVTVFINAKRGAVKALASLISSILAVTIALALSSGLSGTIYKVAVRDTINDKLTKSLLENETTGPLKSYMEGLGYNIIVNTDKLDKILDTGENYDEQLFEYVNNINGKQVVSEAEFTTKIHAGYAEVFRTGIGKEVNRYVSAAAAEKIRNGEIKVEPLFSKLRVVDASLKPAANIICDEYIEEPYRNYIGIILFVVLFAAGYIICRFLVNSMLTKSTGFQSTGSKVAGGIVGVIVGAVYIAFAASLVRLSVIGGSNEMLFFNHDAINKTFIFRHFYELMSKIG